MTNIQRVFRELFPSLIYMDDESAVAFMGQEIVDLRMRSGELVTRTVASSGIIVNPEDVGRVLAEVQKRREEQDAKWGGENHDDEHRYYDWLNFIGKFRERAYAAGMNDDSAEYQDCLIDIAALAVAAVQSSRRIQHRGRP